MSAAAVARAARALVGSRFRLHGRDPAHGVDCVGLVALSLRAGGVAVRVPAGYALRSGDLRRVEDALRAAGLRSAPAPVAGNVVVAWAGAGQLHLAIRSEAGLVHADAVLRRVIERPGPAPWPIASEWRR